MNPKTQDPKGYGLKPMKSMQDMDFSFGHIHIWAPHSGQTLSHHDFGSWNLDLLGFGDFGILYPIYT